MKLTALSSLLVTTYICFVSTAHASTPAVVFSPEQEARIGEIAAEYLTAHPDILVTVSMKLQEQKREREQLTFAVRVMDNQAALLNDPDTPSSGPANADVAVIEFFDYQCVFCSKMAPEMEAVMKSRPDVRYFFKEWPIFGDRWENSTKAAGYGLSVWKQKGAEAYVTYHNAVYATGHDEGKLTGQDIVQSAGLAGFTGPVRDDFSPLLARNDALARALGLTGTPGIIVMPVKGATPKNITVFPEYVPAASLEAAIQKASTAH